MEEKGRKVISDRSKTQGFGWTVVIKKTGKKWLTQKSTVAKWKQEETEAQASFSQNVNVFLGIMHMENS